MKCVAYFIAGLLGNSARLNENNYDRRLAVVSRSFSFVWGFLAPTQKKRRSGHARLDSQFIPRAGHIANVPLPNSPCSGFAIEHASTIVSVKPDTYTYCILDSRPPHDHMPLMLGHSAIITAKYRSLF